MDRHVPRREFLKAATAAAGALAYGAAPAAIQAPRPSSVRISATPYTPVAGYPIRAKRYSDVTMRDGFWAPRIATNAAVTIPFEMQKLEEAGREFSGNIFEAAILSLKTHPNPQLQSKLEARLQNAMNRRGNTNGGFETAVTLFQTTGRRDLLESARNTADVIYDDFVRNNPPFSGGERDAINCIQLYRATHHKKHLDLAKHYLDIRGLETSVNRSRHNQSYKPVLEQREAVGHAVNCVTLMVSLADVGVLTGLKDYFVTARRMWADAVEKKMYVTGGVGSTGNEGFGEPYSLPTIAAYSETCAVLMFMTLNHRLFLATGDSQYIDVLERGMYNNAIDGVSLSGDRFFYVNRLASAGDGRDRRWQRASLECCPPNLVRFLAQMPGYMYAEGPRGAIYVNLYASSDASFTMAGQSVTLSVESEMPWGGKSAVNVATATDARGSIKFRIPGWARNRPVPGGLYRYADPAPRAAAILLNGRAISAAPDPLGYVTLDRVWTNGDVVELDFPVESRRVVADERVKDTRRHLAVERGPIVYCAEWPEVPGGRAMDLLVDQKAPLTATFAKNLLGGAVVINVDARSLSNPSAPKPIALIPYALWANREPGEMTVWLSHGGYAIGDVGPAGGLIFYENQNYAADGWRYLEAAPVDQSAGAKWGCFRTLIAGARGTAIGTGRQNTRDMLAACTERGSAADLCATYTLNGVGGWFLPSRDELALMYENLRATGAGDFRDAGMTDNCSYWASSQQTADMAAHIDFADNGRQHGDDKDFPRRVRAIRAF